MISCGWCNTHYTTWRHRCDSCGGPMPPLPGHEIGEPPPPVPRPLPRGFALRTLLTGNFAVLLGAFTSLITYACVKQRVWAAVAFMGLFALGSWSVF